MSSEQTLSTADLRATAQDYKRIEDDKQKSENRIHRR